LSSLKARGVRAPPGRAAKEAPDPGVLGGGHRPLPPARPRGEAPPLEPEPGREPAGLVEDARLDGALGRRLVQWPKFLVGHQPRRQRSLGREALLHARPDVERVGVVSTHGPFLSRAPPRPRRAARARPRPSTGRQAVRARGGWGGWSRGAGGWVEARGVPR